MTKQAQVENTEVLDQSLVPTISGAEARDALPAEAFNADHFSGNGVALFSTMPNTGKRADRIKLYNAVANAEKKVSDLIGETITVVHMVAHPTQMLDEETGELRDLTRIVLIGPEGESYHSMSNGVVQSMKRICDIVGAGPWEDEPLVIKVKQISTQSGNRTFNLELIG